MEHLYWPFFEPRHRTFAERLDAWATANLPPGEPADVDVACRHLVRRLGDAGWLDAAVSEMPDVRTICLAREILARHAGLADFAFAMQGLGTAPVVLAGSPELRARVLPPTRAGTHIAAFALSEPEAGSDAAALATTAAKVAGGWRIDGEKTFISNGGIADHYVVFARTGEAGARGVSAFYVPADAPGLTVAARIETIAPHPLARLRFENCVVADAALLGQPGEGFRIAMATLDIFRTSVGAAALGFARHALTEALARAKVRRMFGATLGELPLAQAKLADMALRVDASALLVYRAAWARDVQGRRITREAAMAKLHATEAAQRVIDDAVQLFGGLGVTRGTAVESLYREIRALRIYEGASEVQRLVIGRQVLTPPKN
ncbi:MAG: acyl-CoA dehydrogenase family protein [Alphaproteobacteria bacterium]|nr:acyl-CoA dehydrogenase family protein [Alphaproteobacteria bacterium]